MDETGVLGLLEELSILLEDSKTVFGKSNMRQVDISAAFEIMDEIRDIFPGEFAQARQIVRERQALLEDAEDEANRLIEDARSQAMTIASEQEIVRISQQQAETIMADARELERETRAGAEDYADEVFGTEPGQRLVPGAPREGPLERECHERPLGPRSWDQEPGRLRVCAGGLRIGKGSDHGTRQDPCPERADGTSGDAGVRGNLPAGWAFHER